jgi:bidirectional [NiFe] hydrogenase diaphorase subunit
MIRITLDGREIEIKSGQTVLEVAREQGIHIPTLCYHEAMEPFAACRLCMVEVDSGGGWKLVASCAYPCTDGLSIRTQSDAVSQSRQITVELLMASAAHIHIIRKLAKDLGLEEPRYTMDKDDCILCGLCVRACREIVGVGAISLINRGIEKKISTPFQIASNACIECGTCVLVCPTGALSFEDITTGGRTIHTCKSEFDALNCRICGHHDLIPRVADQVTLTTWEEDFSMKEEVSESAR